MPARPPDEIETNDPASIARRFTGPEADEIFLVCRPARPADTVDGQATSVLQALLKLLASHGASYDHVVGETVFFRHIREDLGVFLETRRRVLGDPARRSGAPPSMTLVEQPPLGHRGCLELSAHAVIPRRPDACSAWTVSGASPRGGDAHRRLHGRCVRLADQTHFLAGNVHGTGGTAFDEAYGLFASADALLRQAEMTFRDVVRTWIYVRDIDRDYAELNRARTTFFREQGITAHPASTGIGGGSSIDGCDFSMSLLALRSSRPLRIEVMSSPTLNEASAYGSDFSRGLRVEEANRITLHVSGTASVDEAGRTIHAGNFDAQVGRMLTNVSSLLEAQGASFRDVVSAVTYLKRPADATRLRGLFRDRGFVGFPTVLVQAPICRPDLLCETEATAALPLPETGGVAGGTREPPGHRRASSGDA
jgi:enamine deaminase RidA (YjgF/YER057c/UK114 family)